MRNALLFTACAGTVYAIRGADVQPEPRSLAGFLAYETKGNGDARALIAQRVAAVWADQGEQVKPTVHRDPPPPLVFLKEPIIHKSFAPDAQS